MIRPDLLPHQLALVEEYSAGVAPRAVALSAPTGTGKSVALTVIARDRAAAGALVVLVAPRPLIEQWRHQLVGLGTSPALVFASPADFRATVDRELDLWPASGLILLASTVLRTPLVEKAIRTLVPDLLIVDDDRVAASSRMSRVLTTLAEKAGAVLAATTSDLVAWYPTAELRRWAYPLFDRSGRPFGPEFTVRVHDYDVSEAEAEVLRDAEALISRLGLPTHAAGQTRPSLQSSLLSIARRMESPDQLALWQEGQQELDFVREWQPGPDPRVMDSVWELLDAFDNLPDDARLAAVISETADATDSGRPAIIVGERLREVEYITAAFHEAGVTVETLTGRDSYESRALAIDHLRSGGVTVATPVVFDVEPRLPDRTRSVMYATPRSLRQARDRLGVGSATTGVEVVLLRPSPPVTRQDRDVANLAAGLAQQWTGSGR